MSGTYVVTGSASGIGAATAQRLAAAGNRVIGVDLRNADIEADLSVPDERGRAVAEALEACGGTLDGLVPCAGVGPPFDPSQIMSINYFGSEAFISGLLPALTAAGSARVVAICSNSTAITPNVPADLVDACLDGDETTARQMAADHGDAISYAASKTAIARLVRRTAVTPEWAGAGIRMNAIAPGAVMTPLLQGGLDDEVVGPQIGMLPIPTGGFGTPDQIATWIEFMLGDAAEFMCGSIVWVDGGSDALIRPNDWPMTYSM